jgi:hypothetical protein
MAVNGALPVSTRDRERFVPPHYDHQDPTAPVYVLAPLTVAERRRLLRAVMGETGFFVTLKELRECLRDGAIAEFDPEEAARVSGALEELGMYEGAKQADDAIVARMEELRAKVTRWQLDLSRIYRPLSQLLAAQLGQLDALATMTTRACVRDWENLAVQCRRKGGMVTEEAMMAVPEKDLDALADRCGALREVPADQEPGSASL